MKKQIASKKTLPNKRIHEKEIVGLMIKIYCRGNKHSRDGLCSDCQALIDYSDERVDRCPFMETKTFCQNCKAHCYKSDMRAKIKKVMRYSGPRMILYHPIITINHGIQTYKEKTRRKGED